MFFGKRKRAIIIEDTAVSVVDISGEDYICLTDMVRGEEGGDHIRNWMRNRNTVEFLGLWESMSNPHFKPVEFDRFKKEAGLNSFNLTPKKWTETTQAIGIVVKSGRYGGTYAHRDIAFEFGTWISPRFKLYLIKEYQRLKAIENNQYNLEWHVKRILSKTNYHIHTDAVKEHIIPVSTKWRKEFEYAEEADILNLALFGCTAKEWRQQNSARHEAGENIRESASINELIVLSNMESMNAKMIRDGLNRQQRFEQLTITIQHELSILNQNFMKSLKRSAEDIYLLESKKKDN